MPLRRQHPLLHRHRLVVEHLRSMVGRVHGRRMGVLDLALPRELVEQQPLPCWISQIRSSMQSLASSRCTCTVRTCPIRCARAIACSSVLGFHCGSVRITTDAACMLIPTPPASI
jgi:hypothetical protein